MHSFALCRCFAAFTLVVVAHPPLSLVLKKESQKRIAVRTLFDRPPCCCRTESRNFENKQPLQQPPIHSTEAAIVGSLVDDHSFITIDFPAFLSFGHSNSCLLIQHISIHSRHPKFPIHDHKTPLDKGPTSYTSSHRTLLPASTKEDRLLEVTAFITCSIWPFCLFRCRSPSNTIKTFPRSYSTTSSNKILQKHVLIS